MYMYEVWSKNNHYFQISWVTYVRFSHFFSVMLVYMSVIYVDNISHFGLSVCFWQIKMLVVFWCALRFFCYSKKWIKETVLSFEIKRARTFEMLIAAFGESTMSRTDLRKAEKMSMTMLVLVARALQQPMKRL